MADVTGGDAAEREAPRTLLGRLGIVGPGIVVAVTGVGAGDMVTSLVAGTSFGTALLWPSSWAPCSSASSPRA